MRAYRLVVLLALGLAACRDSTAPARTPGNTSVFGFWMTETLNSDGTTVQTSLDLGTNMTFSRSWRMYSARPRSELTAYVITEGNFTARGDSLFARATTVRNWDRDFNGGVVTVTPVRDGGPYGSPGAHFEIRNDSLVLRYLSYPADAPVETTEALRRTYLVM